MPKKNQSHTTFPSHLESRTRSILEILRDDNPHPKTELVYEDPYTLLVAVMLSAQSTDVSINKVTPALFARAGTPQDMMQLSLDEVEGYLRTINLYKTKSKNLLALSRILMEQHEGQVPHDRAKLEALPGVGRKTTNVVLSIAFDEPTLAVDTHIHRVAGRMGLCEAKTALETEQALLKIIPLEHLKNAHHWLILHGRYICKARKPLCDECKVRDHCDFWKNLKGA